MKKLLILSGVLEIGTGLALLVTPALAARLLLGAELTSVAMPLSRVLGIALLSLGAGCFVGSIWLAMWLYTALVTLYLVYLGAATEWHGKLLWPAVAVHTCLTVLLVWRRSPVQQARN